MPSPFPGMDPYIEHPGVWRHVHKALPDSISTYLNTHLPAGYYAQMEERLEVLPEPDDGRGGSRCDDVGVLRNGSGSGAAVAFEPARATVSPSRRVAGQEPATLMDVEVYRTDGTKVTQIELLSPANKLGSGRAEFLQKRRELLNSEIALVEIDLLRRGRRPCTDADGGPTVWVPPGTSYLVLVSRPWERWDGGLTWEAFDVALDDPLPVVPVPLAEGEPDTPLDLQYCFTGMYDGGPFRRASGRFYDCSTYPPLPPEAADWAAARLAAWRSAA